MTNNFNPFHLVDVSPWPIISSASTIALVTTGLTFINNTSNPLIAMAVFTLALISFSWWRDVHREASSQGMHPEKVIEGLNTGIILFILSEVLFFTSFFWAFFHSSVSPTVELGQSWPPTAISPFNPMSVPLLNTILLISSGVSVTWSHHEILNNNISSANNALNATVTLGAVFSVFQGLEYATAPFSISDSSFGSSFFIATGFHGIHVLIGSLFLIVAHTRLSNIANDSSHLVGFECAAWYWHFVDVVWLFLYSMVYWWGS